MSITYQSGQHVANSMRGGDWLWVSAIHEHDVGHLDEKTQIKMRSELDKAVGAICEKYDI